MSVVTVDRGAALSISTTPPGVRTSPASPAMGSVLLSATTAGSSHWTTPTLPAFTLPTMGSVLSIMAKAESNRWMVTRLEKKPPTTMPPGRGSGAFSCAGGGTSSSSSSSSGWGLGVEV